MCVENVKPDLDKEVPDGLKKSFSFRLGTTSYIVPDDIIPNVRFLADKIDDIELVLFESDEMSNIPTTDAVKQLGKLACANDLTYTVHLPLDIETGHESEIVRRRSVEKCRRIIELMSPISPLAYILHLHGDERGRVPSRDMKRWRKKSLKSVKELAGFAPSRKICVETLDYPFSFIEDLVFDTDLSVCMDIGHLIYYGYSLEDHFDRYLERTRVVHLHGIDNGHDHRAISHLSDELLGMIMGRLSEGLSSENAVTLEIFGESDFSKSIQKLKRIKKICR